MNVIDKLNEEFDEVQEENEILKEKIEELEDFDSKLSEQRLDEIIKLEGRVKELEEENEELKNTIENLKKHYETDLMEWKGKNKSLQDMLDLYIEASK